MNGISSVTDSPRPGQAHRVVTPEAIAAVEASVKENRLVTVNEIAAHLDTSHGSAHHIVQGVLQFIYIFVYLIFFHLTHTRTVRRLLFCTLINKFTIISQIFTLLHVSTLSCHPQAACNQYLAKLHKYFKYIPGQHDSIVNIQTVYTASTQTDFMRFVAT